MNATDVMNYAETMKWREQEVEKRLRNAMNCPSSITPLAYAKQRLAHWEKEREKLFSEPPEVPEVSLWNVVVHRLQQQLDQKQ